MIHGLVGGKPQRVVDALQGSQPDGRDRAGMFEVEAFGYRRDRVGRYRHILGIEAALLVVPAVGIDAIPDGDMADARSVRGDEASAVGAENQRKVRRAAAWRPAVPNVGI